jgi:hypothetical protein
MPQGYSDETAKNVGKIPTKYRIVPSGLAGRSFAR